MKLALSQVCSLNSQFETDIADYSAGQCEAIELWFTKLENYVQQYSVEQTRQLLTQHGMTAPVASYQGGLLTSQGENRKAAWKLFEQRLTLCREIGIAMVVVACDIAHPLNQQTIERARESLISVAQMAGQAGIRVALEFQARAAFGNNLQTAAALIAEVGSPHLGICLDSFQYYLSSSKTEDLNYLTPENLFHVQLCDLADTPRELATDADRILPGDGDIALAPIISHLKAIEFQGYVGVELMNPQIWQIPALQFGEIGMTALRKLLGIANME